MSKVDGSLKALLQGVSQQPPRDRLAGQCTEMVNMTADPVAGLSRRAPTDLVGALGVSSDVRGFHNFEMRNGRKFLAFFRNGGIRVTDYNTDEYPVTVVGAAGAYIAAAGSLACTTVENQVIIANKSIKTAMLPTKRSYVNAGTGALGRMALLYVRGGAYGREYSIFRDGTRIAMYRTPDGSSAAMVNFTRTEHIARRLFECLTGAAGTTTSIDGTGSEQIRSGDLANTTNWEVVRWADIISIRNKVGNTTYTITSSDDSGNVNLKTIQDTVASSEDLPPKAPHGYLARVAEEADSEEDLLFEFIVDGLTPGVSMGTGFGQPGYWQETVSPTVSYKMDKTTMPHVLEYDEATESFTFRQGSWADRKVGTIVTNPDPSFIGSTINDISTFQGRLVFLSGSYVCMGRTNRFDDFWMGSASQLVDTDPIDISSTAVEASTMQAAVPNNRDLVVFSQKGQFLVFGRSAITPANATLVLTTTFEAELGAKPSAAGRNVFFATNYGRFTGIREFYSEGSTDANDARLITQHVKQYIVGKVNRIISSSNYDTLIIQTKTNMDTVYVYQYIWSDTEKLQSAWSKWKLPFESVFSFFDEEMIYFVMREQTSAGMEHFLYRMSLDIYAEDQVDYPIFLDERFDVQDCYTAFVLPYNRMHTADLTVVQGDGCPNPGMSVAVQSITYDAPNTRYVVTLQNDMQGGDVVVGRPFYSEYRPTVPMIKDGDGVVIGTGKFRVKKFIVSMQATGHIIGQLLSRYGDGEQVEFQGRIVGSPDNRIGFASLVDEQFDMPFREKTDRADVKFFTNRHYPMTLLDIEWVGQFHKSGKRITTGE